MRKYILNKQQVKFITSESMKYDEYVTQTLFIVHNYCRSANIDSLWADKNELKTLLKIQAHIL